MAFLRTGSCGEERCQQNVWMISILTNLCVAKTEPQVTRTIIAIAVGAEDGTCKSVPIVPALKFESVEDAHQVQPRYQHLQTF